MERLKILKIWINCILFAALTVPLNAGASQKPNIILILVDDLGWTDLGCYGNTFVDTPAIDKLAAEGLRFTDAYAAGPVCSPTRYAIQSGQNQARLGLTTFIPGHWRPFERVVTPLNRMGMPLEIITVAETLKSAGYTTGYIGKWHLGAEDLFSPAQQGYDYSRVTHGRHLPGSHYTVDWKTPMEPEKVYRSEHEASLAGDFIRENRDHPFFLMVSPFLVHMPIEAMSEKVAKYEERARETGRSLPHPVYAAMIEHCDDMVRSILDSVETEGLEENTMVVFTSDNGALYRRYDYIEGIDERVSDLSPLRGEKGTLYEGGVRVPLIIRWPGRIQPGSTTSEPAASYDFYPTFAGLAGASLPGGQSIDGVSLEPLFGEPARPLGREALYWHFPHYHHDRPASSIRQGDWKLIEFLDNTSEVQLFNLSVDIGETTDRFSEEPELAGELQRQLRSWRRKVIAAMPLPNPSYDPDRAGEWWSLHTGQPIDSSARRPGPHTELEAAEK